MKKLNIFHTMKPSDAITILLMGVEHFMERESLTFNMETFGDVDPHNNICYGCMATAGVYMLRGDDPTPENMSDRHEGIAIHSWQSISEMENAWDFLRCGDLRNFLSCYRWELESTDLEAEFQERLDSFLDSEYLNQEIFPNATHPFGKYPSEVLIDNDNFPEMYPEFKKRMEHFSTTLKRYNL